MKKIKRLVISVLCTVPLLWVSCEDIVPGDDLVAPIIMQGSSSNATRTSITLTGSFQGISNEVKEIGVVYSTSSGFPEDASVRKKVEGELKNSVSVTLENLTPNMQYYYYWYVSSGPTEITSVPEMFRTEATSAPQFGVAVVDSLDENAMRVRTTILEIGNKCLLECGFEYRKKIAGAKFIPAECDKVPTNDSLGYSVILTELDANTEYEIRPYAKNSDTEDATNGTIEGYGDIITAKTQDKVSPMVNTKEILNVGISAATLVGVITNVPVADSEVTEKGFCLSRENNNPTVYDSTLVVTDATELNKDFVYQLTNLEYNTTYYVRAYAKNTVSGSERVGYGSTMQFTTKQMVSPELEMGYLNETTNERIYVEMESSKAKCYATLVNLETSVLKERGFIWSEDNRNIELEEAKNGNHVVTADGTNSMFTATIEGLNPNKNYYIRAYAVYQSGNITNIGYSGDVNVYTSSRKSTQFRDVKKIEEESTSISLTLTSGITQKGDGDIKEYGILWNTTGNGKLDNCVGYKAAQSEKIDSFKVVVDNIQPGKDYAYRAYVKIDFNGEEIVDYTDSWWYYRTTEVLQNCWNESMSITETSVDIVMHVDTAYIPKGYEEIGLYYTETQDQNIDEVEKKVASTLTEDQKMSVTLTDFKLNTLYYYGLYVKINGRYYGRSYSTFRTMKKPEMGDVESPGMSN